MWRIVSIMATFCTIIVSVICLAFVTLSSEIPLHHDSALFLDYGRLILRGALPYVDYVALDPPITHYLHTIPVVLAEFFGTEAASTFQVLIALLAGYSAAALAVLFGRAPFSFSLTARLFVAGGWLAFSVFSSPIGGFGQREHLFMLTYAPWLVCREIRHGGARVPFEYSILVGLLFGPFLFMKPHFLGIVGVLEAWLLLRSRRFPALFGWEVLVLVCWAILYAGHFLFVPSSMTDALFKRWAPFAARNYWVYDCSLGDLLAAGFPKYFCIPSMTILGFGLAISARKLIPRSLALHVEICGFGTILGLVSFFVQHKGWNYQLLPAYAFLALAAICLLAFVETLSEGERSLPGRPWPLGAKVVVVSVCLVLIAGAVVLARQGLINGRASRPSVDAWNAFIREHSSAEEKIIVVSTGLAPAYPSLIYAGRYPGSRYLLGWPIAMFYAEVVPSSNGRSVYRAESDWTPEERRFLEELGEDVAVRKPALVALQDTPTCQGCPPGFRVNEYLEVIGWEAKYLSAYHFLTRFRDFVIYKRN